MTRGLVGLPSQAMSKKQPPPFTLLPEIDLPEDPVPIHEALERKIEEKWQGLYAVKIHASVNDEGNATIGMIDIPSVIDNTMEPQCPREIIAAYVMTYVNLYTAKRGCKVRYRVRFHQRLDGNRTQQWSIEWTQNPPPEVLAAHDAVQSKTEEVAMERDRTTTTFLGGATDAVSMALDKVTTLVNQAMEMMKLTADQSSRNAERADRTAERYENLVNTIVQDRENHSKIAQTGFDALHHGVEMQGASMQQKWEYEMQIRDLRAEIEKSRNSGQGGMTQSLIQMMTPLLTMAGTQFLTKMGALPPGSDKDVMHAIASQMVPGGGHAGGGSHDETPPPAPPPTGAPRVPAVETPTPPQPSRGLPTVMDISTEEERTERPFTVLLKLFHESFTFKDQQAATSTLRAEEWKLLWDCNDNQDQAMIVALITRFITVVGPTRANAFMSAITPRTRAIFGEILMQCKRYAEKEPFVWSPCTMDASIVSVETKPEVKPAATCPKCTAMWPPEIRFCGRCGASMSAEEAKTEAKVEVHVEPEHADEQEISRKEISKKKGKKKRAAHAGSGLRNVTRDG